MKDTFASPSIIAVWFNNYNNEKKRQKFVKDAEKFGIRVRKVELIDIQIPVDKRYNDAVNFLKQMTTPILREYLNINKLKIPFFDIEKILSSKLKLIPFNYEEFFKHTKLSNLYPYGYLGLTPLFVDGKYKDWKGFETKEEITNYFNLISFKTENYKPLITPTKEEKDFKTLEVEK